MPQRYTFQIINFDTNVIVYFLQFFMPSSSSSSCRALIMTKDLFTNFIHFSRRRCVIFLLHSIKCESVRCRTTPFQIMLVQFVDSNHVRQEILCWNSKSFFAENRKEKHPSHILFRGKKAKSLGRHKNWRHPLLSSLVEMPTIVGICWSCYAHPNKIGATNNNNFYQSF